jgi:hypothetical protein
MVYPLSIIVSSGSSFCISLQFKVRVRVRVGVRVRVNGKR